MHRAAPRPYLLSGPRANMAAPWLLIVAPIQDRRFLFQWRMGFLMASDPVGLSRVRFGIETCSFEAVRAGGDTPHTKGTTALRDRTISRRNLCHKRHKPDRSADGPQTAPDYPLASIPERMNFSWKATPTDDVVRACSMNRTEQGRTYDEQRSGPFDTAPGHRNRGSSLARLLTSLTAGIGFYARRPLRASHYRHSTPLHVSAAVIDAGGRAHCVSILSRSAIRFLLCTHLA